ncbi:MAG: IS3 family transposase, partial [Burkholderiales bacterium]
CVSRSGLPAARRRLPSARTVEEAEIVSQIRRTQAQHRGRYGRPRMTPEVIVSLGRPVHGERFKTRAEAQQAIIEYMGYYNTERRHSSLGNVSRAEFERRGYDESNRVSEASKRWATLFDLLGVH